MIFSWLIVCVSLIQIHLTDSDKALLKEVMPVLTFELVTEKDTVESSEPLNIIINLENISDKTVYIPHDFSVESNLFPNGTSSEVHDGAVVRFSVQPVPACAKLFIEEIAVSEPQRFIQLKPGQIQKYRYDLGFHINRFNDPREKDDCLSIPVGETYYVQARYENIWEYKKRASRSFIGSVQSNKIAIFLKED